jgi:hypothetical protein
MAEDKTLPPHGPGAKAAPEAKGAGEEEKPIDPVKLAGGIVLCVASVAFLLHRLPHFGYVEVHADKGRPVKAVAAVAAVPAPAKAAPAPAAVPAPAKPIAAAVKLPPAAKPVQAMTAQALPSEPQTPVADWLDVCDGEIGLLCYDVPTSKLRRCLRPYLEALRRDCRKALRNSND